MYIYIYIHTYIHTYICIYIYTYIYTHFFVYIEIQALSHTYIYMYVYAYQYRNYNVHSVYVYKPMQYIYIYTVYYGSSFVCVVHNCLRRSRQTIRLNVPSTQQRTTIRSQCDPCCCCRCRQPACRCLPEECVDSLCNSFIGRCAGRGGGRQGVVRPPEAKPTYAKPKHFSKIAPCAPNHGCCTSFYTKRALCFLITSRQCERNIKES